MSSLPSFLTDFVRFVKFEFESENLARAANAAIELEYPSGRIGIFYELREAPAETSLLVGEGDGDTVAGVIHRSGIPFTMGVVERLRCHVTDGWDGREEGDPLFI